jgi:hypothetical protein
MQDKEFLTIVLIVTSITVLGYFLKNNISDKKQKELVNEVIKKKTELIQPYHENIYNSNRLNEVNKELLDKSLSNYEKALKPSETGFIPPYFTIPQSGSTFYEPNEQEKSSFEKTLDKVVTEFSTEERSQIREFNMLDTGLKTVDRAARGDVRTMPMFESFTNQVENTPENLRASRFTEFSPKVIDDEVSLLTGQPMEKQHINMVPFFGSNIKQNVENFTNTSILDTYTGNRDTFVHKIEQGPMFPRVKQDIHGTPMITENVEMDRFIPSNYRQNERPFDPLRIPAPIAGTIENEIRPVYKTVNELRPGNKPKLSYEGRIVDGQKGETRAEYGQVQKQNPLREAEMGYDDFIKGQSDFRKPKFTDKDNYIPVLKDTGRMYTEEVAASGPSRTDFGVRPYLVREEETINFTPME